MLALKLILLSPTIVKALSCPVMYWSVSDSLSNDNTSASLKYILPLERILPVLSIKNLILSSLFLISSRLGSKNACND